MAAAWSEAAIPGLTGVTAVVTGASGGIGLEVAPAWPATVPVWCWPCARPTGARPRPRRSGMPVPARRLEVMALDLADLASVHRFADALRPRLGGLGLLVNNAGVASASQRRTADGFELDFGTSHLGHFALTGLLLPMMISSPQARVITVTSLAHRRGRVEFGNLDGAKGYSPARAYAQSKLANVLFAFELQRRLAQAGAGLLGVACHPGWAAITMTLGPTGEHPRPQDRLSRLLARRLAPHRGARRPAGPVRGNLARRARRGFHRAGRAVRRVGAPGRVRPGDRAREEDLARHLWEVSEQMTGVRYTVPRG